MLKNYRNEWCKKVEEIFLEFQKEEEENKNRLSDQEKPYKFK